jgi:hypothetical protein
VRARGGGAVGMGGRGASARWEGGVWRGSWGVEQGGEWEKGWGRVTKGLIVSGS